MASAWYDVSYRGRRLEAIAKLCNTEFWKYYKTNDEMAESYFNRLMKVEQAIKPYIAEYTGVEKLIKQGKKLEVSPEFLLR